MNEEKNINEPQNPAFLVGVVMRSFTMDDLRKAFDAGRTVSNYKGEWQETYNDGHTSAKYEKFEDWIKNYA